MFKKTLSTLLLLPFLSISTVSDRCFTKCDFRSSYCTGAISSSNVRFIDDEFTVENESFLSERSSDPSLFIQKFNHQAKSLKYLTTSILDENQELSFSGKRTSTQIDYSNFVEGSTRKGIYENDNRIALTKKLDNVPFSCVGKLRGISKNYNGEEQPYDGSCTLLSNGYILTAAHCVYMNDAYSKNITVTFGLNTSNPMRTFNVINSYLPKAWVDSNPENKPGIIPTYEQTKWDWAILEISDKTLPDVYGAPSLFTNKNLSTTTYCSLGYPTGETALTSSKGYGLKSSSSYTYDLYSYVGGGMSGGNVIAFFSDWDERIEQEIRYIGLVGVISRSEPDTDLKTHWAGITRLTNTMLEFIARLGS